MRNAKHVAKQFHEAFTPTVVQTDGLEVIANLDSSTNTPDVLDAVAAWHESPRRRGRRHRAIADALRVAAEAARDGVGDWRVAA